MHTGPIFDLYFSRSIQSGCSLGIPTVGFLILLLLYTCTKLERSRCKGPPTHRTRLHRGGWSELDCTEVYYMKNRVFVELAPYSRLKVAKYRYLYGEGFVTDLGCGFNSFLWRQCQLAVCGELGRPHGKSRGRRPSQLKHVN